MARRNPPVALTSMVWDLVLDPVYREVLLDCGMPLDAKLRACTLETACIVVGLDVLQIVDALRAADRAVQENRR